MARTPENTCADCDGTPHCACFKRAFEQAYEDAGKPDEAADELEGAAHG